MDKFLSCDWGTSFFRLRLADYKTLVVIAEEKNGQGIAKTFNDWKASNPPKDRLVFYSLVIINAIQLLSKQINTNLDGVPVIISGMAASTIGMVDLLYKQIPIPINGSELEKKQLSVPESKNEFIIISGIKSGDDVIRGEETKIAGCASYFNDDEQLIIFAGTHPKHVSIQNKTVIGIKTYMTGEFFSLLANQSILAASVKQNGVFNPENQTWFKKGVEGSLSDNLLHTAFTVRTNDILKSIPKENNYYYLSGLLIGTELKGLADYKRPVYLCGGLDLLGFYQLACDVLGITISAQIDGDEALLKGQKAIYANYVTSPQNNQ